jgi:hypothetical protein
MKHFAIAVLIGSAAVLQSVAPVNASALVYSCLGGPCYPTAVLGLAVGDLTYNIDFHNGYYGDLFPGSALYPNCVEITNALLNVLTDADATDLYFKGSYA